MPTTLRYLYQEEKGSLPTDDESIARKIYDYAVKKKLERVKELSDHEHHDTSCSRTCHWALAP